MRQNPPHQHCQPWPSALEVRVVDPTFHEVLTADRVSRLTTANMLRQNVTSPGGTTAAALQVLMEPDGMQSLLIRAVAAATKRSKELVK